MPPATQHISSAEITSSLPARISYVSAFLDLTPADGEALVSAAPLVAPLIPTILEAVYTKLLSFDITAQAFVPKNTDYEGETAKSVQELTLEHPQIVLRKDFLKTYLLKLFTQTSNLAPTAPLWTYLSNVAIMHTGKPGFKHRAHRPELRVEYVHMGLLLGYVVDVVVGAVLAFPEEQVDLQSKGRLIRALNKIVWIQNDLFARQYVGGGGGGEGEGEKV